jgi:hypothetical protein
MADTLVQGKNALLSVSRNAQDYYPFACAQEVTLSEETELLPTTTATSGEYRTYTTRLSSWKLSHAGVLLLSKSSFLGFPDIFNPADRRAGLYVRVRFVADDGTEKIFQGKVLLPSKSITGTVSQLTKWTAEMQGTGPYTISNVETPGGIMDTTGPSIVAAYVTNDQRSRIVLELSEPLGGYRIPDNEWYPNLSHFSVFSNVDGSKIYIFTNTDYLEGQDIRLTYSGGSVKDVAGNALAFFENLPVENRIGAGVTQFTAWWGWSVADPTDDIFVTGDDSVLSESGLFAYNAPVYADYHDMGQDKYAVMREPLTEPAKTKWVDSGASFNNGTIEDSVWKRFEKWGYRYYITRTPMVFDARVASRVVFST